MLNLSTINNSIYTPDFSVSLYIVSDSNPPNNIESIVKLDIVIFPIISILNNTVCNVYY